MEVTCSSCGGLVKKQEEIADTKSTLVVAQCTSCGKSYFSRENPTVIDSFRKEYFFLSNFYPCPVVYENLLYKSSEAAYQAAKIIGHEERRRFTTMSPSEAKSEGGKVALRKDWDDVKLTVMYDILKNKFRNPLLADALKATGTIHLVEGNRWGDTFWGVCSGEGKNELGKLLMKVREEVK